MAVIAGKKISNWWLIGGGVGLVAVIYLYKKGSLGGGGSSGSSAIDPVTGLPVSQDNQVDPVTGLTYLAEAQQYGSVQAAEQMVTSGSGYLGSGAGTGAIDSGFPTYAGGSAGGTAVGGQLFATNAAWAQAVTAGLVQLGYASTDVSAALGLYFAGQPLPANYATIVQAGVAEFGPPPVGTFQIIPEPSSGGGTGGGNGTGLYWTGTGFTQGQGGAAVSPSSRFMTIGGKKYYYHSQPASHGGHATGAYFTLNGKRASPPPGPVT